MPASQEPNILLANQLVGRLERLSADSFWAHRASGVKGSLLRCLQEIQTPAQSNPPAIDQIQRLRLLTALGFEILAKAAAQIETIDTISGYPRHTWNRSS
jgi:hypothetical protein